MTREEFEISLAQEAPPTGLSAPLTSLWWEAKGNWSFAHAQVDERDSQQAMAVHAYLHRREGDRVNAAYWYRRAGLPVFNGSLEEEWRQLVARLLGSVA